MATSDNTSGRLYLLYLATIAQTPKGIVQKKLKVVKSNDKEWLSQIARDAMWREDGRTILPVIIRITNSDDPELDNYRAEARAVRRINLVVKALNL